MQCRASNLKLSSPISKQKRRPASLFTILLKSVILKSVQCDKCRFLSYFKTTAQASLPRIYHHFLKVTKDGALVAIESECLWKVLKTINIFTCQDLHLFPKYFRIDPKLSAMQQIQRVDPKFALISHSQQITIRQWNL